MSNTTTTAESAFSIRDFFGQCMHYWYWFILSMLVCLGIGVAYLLKTPKQFTRYTTVLIKESATKRNASDLDVILGTGGMTQQSSKLPNEIIALQSPDLMTEVVTRLNLDYNYSVAGRFKKHVIYGSTLPFKVSMPNCAGHASFDIDQVNDSTCRIHNILVSVPGERKPVSDPASYAVAIGDTVLTSMLGPVCIYPSASYTGDLPFGKTVHVDHKSIAAVSRDFNSRLSAAAVDMKNYSDILKLTLTDQSVQKADDVLKTVLSVYNENWVDDRNKMAVSTSMFINDRLVSIEQELGNVDSDISSYKSRNVLPDVAAVSNMYMSQTAETNRSIQDLDNQLYTARYIRNYLANDVGVNQLIPVSSSIGNTSISTQIGQYNNTLLERNNLVAGSSEQNPLVVDLDATLSAMKMSIITSVDNQIATLQAQIGKLQRAEAVATSRLADNPNQAKYLLSVERQQKVKESLYLFLLQKREENELSQAFTAYNTRVITQPTGSSSPTAPQTSKIMLIALLLGLCIPMGIIYLKETLNTRIRGRKDLENISMPFLGEIPQYSESRHPLSLAASLKVPNERILVQSGKRDAVNEAFRVLRTNLEFVMRGSSSQVVAVTSFNPGSGKTFVSSNLVQALAIKKIKAVIVDCDLRKATLSKFVGSPKKGIADYLGYEEQDLESLMKSPEDAPSVKIIPVGSLPPNPSELIGSERFGHAIEQLKSEYDIVMLDCPPIDLVADARIISDHVDRTIFVVRAGLLERSMLQYLEKLYADNTYPGLGLVLNGTQNSGSKYGTHYGYNYGYGYGYGSDGA